MACSFSDIRPRARDIEVTGSYNGHFVPDDGEANYWTTSINEKNLSVTQRGETLTVTYRYKSNAYRADGVNAVKLIQQRLSVARTGLSGAELTVDGVFGSKSLAAVKRFQNCVNVEKLHGTGDSIAVDGIVGSATWSWLK